MKISVIIPTHNRSDALRLTLERLAAQNFDGEWEVIVANNNSTDDTDEVVRAWQQKFPVPLRLVQEKTPGAGAARNTGARVAAGEYLIFIDNDILTEPDFIQRHLHALEQNPNSWIMGQIVNLPEQENSVFGKYRKTLFPVLPIDESIRETNAITGQTVSMPREHFIQLNGFDEKFTFCGEDQEFAMRARKQLKAKTLLAPGILVLHNDWAGWTFQDFCLRQRIYARSEFFFWKKYSDEHPRQQLVRENLPVNWREDSVKLIVRKHLKQLLGGDTSQNLLVRLCMLIEQSSIPRPVLWRLYKLTLAGAINRGFHEGRESVLAEAQSHNGKSELYN